MLRFCISRQCSLSQIKYSPPCGCKLIGKWHHPPRHWSQNPYWHPWCFLSPFLYPVSSATLPIPPFWAHAIKSCPFHLLSISWIHPQPWPRVDHCHLSPDGLQHPPSPQPSCFSLVHVNPFSTLTSTHGSTPLKSPPWIPIQSSFY